jgi:hypothetical protein
MMLPPNPGDLDRMIRDHQEQLNNPHPRPHGNEGWLRVRVGRALIAAGTTLSGERAERPARHSAHARTA